MLRIIPSEDEINDTLNRCSDQENEGGGSQWPGMTYEQGVAAAIKWIIGDQTDNPMDD